MSSSDEEGEIVPDSAINYYFVDKNEEVVSFSVLPLQWKEGEMLQEPALPVYLCGTSDDGLQRIYKRVIAWKFELSFVLPEIYALSKDKLWIKLHRPRKSYEDSIKTILVAVHVLHFAKKNPKESGKTLWDYILKILSTYEVLPSENDLLDHVPLFNEAIQRDKDIANSKYIADFLFEIQDRRRSCNEESRVPKKQKFIIEEDSELCSSDANDSADEEHYYSVCAYCDDGGEMLWCDGRCLRSFHPTTESGTESFCESLGYTREQADV